ncbi:glycosyltransferase [Nocardioides oleivorans]|uniref:glycosyltransferase n=1 Tax=Nocardioides oleivorans TaxID=273676 RepID=UPI001F5E0EF2|nr:glycosyltransferase [Nocardioides oleivorans]
MTGGLRVCLIASSRFPIREPFAGGLEAHTSTLATELHRRGNTVSVFAAPGSHLECPVELLDVPPFRASRAARADVAAPPELWMQEHHAYLTLMMRLVRSGAREFDVVLNNSLHHLPVAMASVLPVPMVTILHTPPVPWLESAIEVAGSGSTFVTVSAAMGRAWAHATTSHTILNGVDGARWKPGPGGQDAVWSGRIAPEKAPHEAIDAARRSGRAIVLAGPIMDEDYFEKEVRHRLGPEVRYAGHLGQEELCRLVGSSEVALVTPTWDEPFGLVAAEAMSCGTPVAGYARGGLVEIVTPESGRLATSRDVPALAVAIDAAAGLDRRAVHAHATAAHGLARMVDDYEALFASLLLEEAA